MPEMIFKQTRGYRLPPADSGLGFGAGGANGRGAVEKR
jgi:hypothetical protein